MQAHLLLALTLLPAASSAQAPATGPQDTSPHAPAPDGAAPDGAGSGTAASGPADASPAAAGSLRTPAELSAAGWQLVDGVIAQAGSEIVTLSDLEHFLLKRLGPDLSPERARQLAPRALQTLETGHLEAQAGEDLGIQRKEVQRIIQQSLEDRRREQGVEGYLDYLKSEGLDPREAIDSQSNELYRVLWTREQLGIPSASGRRITMDPYLRPGTLRLFYRENQDLLGDPPQVRFQRIFIQAKGPDDLAAARQRAVEAIAHAGEGASFPELLDQYSDEDPLQSLEKEWVSIPQLAQNDPALATFARRAPEGAVYPQPLPAYPSSDTDAKKQAGWFVYRLNDRLAGHPPPFESRETQSRLRKLLQDQWRDGVLGNRRQLLTSDSYLWRDARYGGDDAGGTPPAQPGS